MHPPHKRNIIQEFKFPLYAIELFQQWKQLEQKHPNFEQHPILVLPGFGASDRSTYLLRTFLQKCGLEVYDWQLGFNHGDIRKLIPPLIDRLSDISKHHNCSVVLIGWSLGGIIARELSRVSEKDVRAICCLGSPIVGGPISTIYAPLYTYMGKDLSKIAHIIEKRESMPLQVPSHVIYSKKDGIVHWEACLDTFNEHTTYTEVNTPHFSMGFSVEIYCELLRWLKTILPNKKQI